jgi:hypothetical protein
VGLIAITIDHPYSKDSAPEVPEPYQLSSALEIISPYDGFIIDGYAQCWRTSEGLLTCTQDTSSAGMSSLIQWKL